MPASGRPRWPDLFLVGAAMAGTTVLRAHLRRHPGIFMAAHEQPHYFSRVRASRRFARTLPVVADEAGYLGLFADAPHGSVAGEASTSYLWSPEAPERIAAVAPDARIVVLLRDPIERAWAHHRSDAAAGAERRSFLRAIRDELARPGTWGVEPVYLGASLYADGLERYLARFPREQVDVRFSESFLVDPWPATREVMAWLGLDAAAAQPPESSGEMAIGVRPARERGLLGALGRGRAHGVPPPPVMDETIRRLLEDVFAPDVARVSDLLGVIPPWSISPAPGI